MAPSSTSSEAYSSSGGKSSSRSSSSSVDPALSAAVQSLGTALGAYIGEAFDRASTNYYAGSDHHYSGTRPGDENGELVVGRNGRHGNVGVFSNDTRLWKLPPIYKDVNIASLGTTFVTNRKDKVGVMDFSGPSGTTIPGSLPMNSTRLALPRTESSQYAETGTSCSALTDASKPLLWDLKRTPCDEKDDCHISVAVGFFWFSCGTSRN